MPEFVTRHCHGRSTFSSGLSRAESGDGESVPRTAVSGCSKNRAQCAHKLAPGWQPRHDSRGKWNIHCAHESLGEEFSTHDRVAESVLDQEAAKALLARARHERTTLLGPGQLHAPTLVTL